MKTIFHLAVSQKRQKETFCKASYAVPLRRPCRALAFFRMAA